MKIKLYIACKMRYTAGADGSGHLAFHSREETGTPAGCATTNQTKSNIYYHEKNIHYTPCPHRHSLR